MEMGVNRGPPPGSGITAGYQGISNAGYQQPNYSDGPYYPGQGLQPGAIYRPNHPHIMSPNQSHQYHKQGVIGYQTSPEQAQFMAKKQAYLNECAGFSMQQPPQAPQGMMFSPNGVTTSQAMHVNPGIGPQQARYMMQGQIQGHSPNQSQIQGHMMYQGQGQMGARMMWYQESGMSSPPGGMPARFSGNHGNRQLQMMSPPPQAMAPSPQQQQQIRHMMMSPGQPHPPGLGHGPAQMGPRAHQQHYVTEQALPRGTLCPSSQGYQTRPQHYQQYGGPQVTHHPLHPQMPTPAQNYTSPPQQPSPGIPYSQALEGYTSPIQTQMPNSFNQSEFGVVEPRTMLQTMLPASSTVHGACVYTMANTQTLQSTTSSTGTVMSGQYAHLCPNMNTGQVKAPSDIAIGSSYSCSQSNASNKSHDCSHRNSVSRSGVTEQSLPANESKSITVDTKRANCTSISDDETSERICMQMSYSSAISKSDHSSTHTTVTTTSCQTRPTGQVLTKTANLSSTCVSSHGDDSSMVIVPFGWKRVMEDGIIAYYSPSQTRLGSHGAIIEYLITGGTCKCGLSCPLLVEKTFNFDPSITSKDWKADSIKNSDDLNNLCNHKRKIMAMASLQTPLSLQSTSQFCESPQAASKVLEALSMNKKEGTKKKKSKVKASVMNPYDGMLVSQLLLHRDKMRERCVNTPYIDSHDAPGSQSSMKSQEGAARFTYDDASMKVNAVNSGTSPDCGDEIKSEAMLSSPSMPPHACMNDPMQMSPSCRNTSEGHFSQHMPQGPGNPFTTPNQHHRMHKPQNPFEMLMGPHRPKGQSPEGQMMNPGQHNQMPFGGQQKNCMFNQVNQMFSLQLQIQAQAAAARNANTGHRFGMPSPSLSSHSQQSSPSPGHLHGKKPDNTLPSYFDQSSPSPVHGPYRGTSMGPCLNNRIMSPPHNMGGPQFLAPQNPGSNPNDPPVKKKKKKKRKKNALNKVMSEIMDRNIPCPNVDVRQFSQKRNNPATSMMQAVPMGVSQGQRVPSFMDNPAAFLAQQAQMVTNNLQSTFTDDIPMYRSHKRQAVSKEDSLEHLLGVPSEQSSSTDRSAINCRPDSSQSAGNDSSCTALSRESNQSECPVTDAQHEAELECSSRILPATSVDVKSISSQRSDILSKSVTVSSEETAEMKHNQKEFPASCLLTATARGQLSQPSNSPAPGTKSPGSLWSSGGRSRASSGPAPIRHVPPGGQHIGGGSIVYHHNIENQQAFHEGGVVNGGGILMVSGPANQGDSFMVNCLPGAPFMLQGAMGGKCMQLLRDSNSTVGLPMMPMDAKTTKDNLSEDENVAVMRNLLQAGMHEQLQAKMASMMTSKEQSSNPIQMVQNLISGIGNGNSRNLTSTACGMLNHATTEHSIAASVAGESFASDKSIQREPLQLNGLQEGIINGMTVPHLSRHMVMQPINMAMPQMSVAAVTAVTDSITQVISTAGMQVARGVLGPETNVSGSVMADNSGIKDMHHDETSASLPEPGMDLESGAIQIKQELEEDPVESSTRTQDDEQPENCTAHLDQPVPETTTGETQTAFVSSGTLKTKFSLKGTKKKKKKKKKKLKVGIPQPAVDLPEQMCQSSQEPTVHDNVVSQSVADGEGDLNSSSEPVQDQDQYTEEEAMLAHYQDETFAVVQPEMLESGQIMLEQGQSFQQFIQSQGQELGPMCITSEGQGQIAIAQGQATNIIQTLSFMPNVVGIDPNTGLVQSIQMPMGPGSQTAKDETSTSDQVSPLSQTQMVQTVMQSLQIQNNVLVQGMSPNGVPGTFIQPLGTVGNTLIPFFPEQMTVSGSSEEGSLSMMSVNQQDASTEEPLQYVQSQRPSSNVVSTQTEAVQTEDSCSDLMDAEGGGRLLVESEDGILADDSYLLEDEEPDADCSSYSMDHSLVSPSQSISESTTLTEQNSLETSQDGISPVHTASPQDSEITNSQSPTSVQPGNTPEDSLSSTDEQINQQDSVPEVRTDTPIKHSEASTQLTSRRNDIKPLEKNHSTQSSELVVSEVKTTDETTQESIVNESSLAISDSSITAAVHLENEPDIGVHTDSASESVGMPVLSRESSVLSEQQKMPVQERNITPAMTIIQTRLEHSIKLYQDLDLDEFDAFQVYNNPNITSVDELPEEILPSEVVQEAPKEERFGEPPTLSAMTSLKNSNKNRTPFGKRRGRLKRKPKKMIRTNRLNDIRLQSPAPVYDIKPDVNDPEQKPIISMNNNKPTEIIPETKLSDTEVLPEIVEEEKVATCGKDELMDKETEFVDELPSAEPKMSVSSTGASSDGEANQSSDSSQSMSTSEGDEVRCGNSPSIRCSNLLTSSPETNELNCSGLTHFNKLDNICAEGGANHVIKANNQITTRRSLRSELDSILPHHGKKRSLSDSASDNKASNDENTEVTDLAVKNMRTLRPGELIWGPVKSYPSWPGKLVHYDDVPKSPDCEDGKPWVHWFGFHTYSQVEPQELKTLTEGLEAHHDARQKHRKGRKLNSALETAIQEAMVELDRQMEQDNDTIVTTEISVDPKINKINSTKKKKLR